MIALSGSIGTSGGTSPNGWNKFVPAAPDLPTHHERWNELTFPRDYPLAQTSFRILLPHFLPRDGAARRLLLPGLQPGLDQPGRVLLDEELADEDKVGLHVALTPTWCETA